mgnify:CR=1 FL=1
MRVFKIAAGVILILMGIICFANPGTLFSGIAFPLGCAMFLSGLSGAFAYIQISRKGGVVSDLLMVEGALSIILGCLVLSNQLMADAAIPVFFGMWVMFSGILRAVTAYTHRNAEKMMLIWLSATGALSIAAGLYGFFNTVLFDFSAVVLTGVLFVIQGVNVLLVGVNLNLHRAK